MMKKAEKFFTKTNMSWRLVLLLSVCCGVIPGLLMVPPALNGTSLQQPGISFEFWILAAMFIVLNCKRPAEAGLKTFVFFLISQPIIYLVQVPFSWMHWHIFSYYPRWALITLLTLPGGMLAWYAGRDNWLGVLILSAADLILCAELPYMFASMLRNFPHLLLTVLFIAAELVFFTLLIFKKRSTRLASFAIVALMLIMSTLYTWKLSSSLDIVFTAEPDCAAPFEIVSDCPDADVTTDGSVLTVHVRYPCSFPIDLRDAEGDIVTVYFSYDGTSAAWRTETG